mgnify:CR=1 FL=1|jgi:hypothetical protein|tara:strand:+ start:438 stop:644 length:207 start_codon:yes stop_codon:yes gene_type:complete
MTIETVKLINSSGKIIERKKSDYESNITALTDRGWKLHDGKVAKKVSSPVKQVSKTIKKVTKKKKTKK